MPVRVDRILVDFEPYTETIIMLLGSIIVVSKSNPLIGLSVAIVLVSILTVMLKYNATCSECLEKSVKQTAIQ